MPLTISVVIISRNADQFMRDALDSLMFQSMKPLEVIVVDANSTDDTQAIVKSYSKKYDIVRLLIDPGTRGEGRNAGAREAKGDIVAFMDADAIANAMWIEELTNAFEDADIVAGREVRLGFSGFTSLKRVGMIHKGVDVTYPSVNLAYKKKVFEAVGGFDPWFKEAEEVDLNFRAVDAGYKLVYCESAIMYHLARDSMMGFLKQSFWYGFGRKELSHRHGDLWDSYDPIEMVRVSSEESIWKLVRLGISFFGYMFAKVAGTDKGAKERWRKSKASER